MSWKKIKRIRKDMSEFVLHCTRAFDVLQLILEDGFFRAGFASGRSPLARESKPKVRGPYPAVCFTEQPLRFFTQSISADRRYTEFAIAVRKDQLFNYGGRPVLYNDEEVLGKKLPPKEHENRNYPPEAWVYEGGLPLDLQYLWVYYDPTAMWLGDRDDPIDFTHEREWRARPNIGFNKQLGLSEQDEKIAVPLQLPTDPPGYYSVGPRPKECPRFVILVDSEGRKQELIEWIGNNADRISERGLYRERYSDALQEAPILSFETINDTGSELVRLEDFINDDFTLNDSLTQSIMIGEFIRKCKELEQALLSLYESMYPDSFDYEGSHLNLPFLLKLNEEGIISKDPADVLGILGLLQVILLRSEFPTVDVDIKGMLPKLNALLDELTSDS